MLGLGLGEILMIGAVILVFVGPERLPHLFRTAGQLYAQVRRASEELRRAMVLEADRMDAEEQLAAAAARRAAAEAQARDATREGQVAQARDLFGPPAPASPAPDPAPPEGPA